MRSRDMCVCVYVCMCSCVCVSRGKGERVSIFFVSDTSTLSTSRNRSASACDTWILSFFWVHDAVSTVSMFAASWNRVSTYSQVERMTGLWVTSAAPYPCVVTVLTRYCVTSTWLRARSKYAQVQYCGRSLHPFFHRETLRGLCQRVDSGAISPLFHEVLLLVPYQMNLGRLYVVCKNFVTLYTPAATELTVYFHFLDCNLE